MRRVPYYKRKRCRANKNRTRVQTAPAVELIRFRCASIVRSRVLVELIPYFYYLYRTIRFFFFVLVPPGNIISNKKLPYHTRGSGKVFFFPRVCVRACVYIYIYDTRLWIGIKVRFYFLKIPSQTQINTGVKVN